MSYCNWVDIYFPTVSTKYLFAKLDLTLTTSLIMILNILLISLTINVYATHSIMIKFENSFNNIVIIYIISSLSLFYIDILLYFVLKPYYTCKI